MPTEPREGASASRARRVSRPSSSTSRVECSDAAERSAELACRAPSSSTSLHVYSTSPGASTPDRAASDPGRTSVTRTPAPRRSDARTSSSKAASVSCAALGSHGSTGRTSARGTGIGGSTLPSPRGVISGETPPRGERGDPRPPLELRARLGTREIAIGGIMNVGPAASCSDCRSSTAFSRPFPVRDDGAGAEPFGGPPSRRPLISAGTRSLCPLAAGGATADGAAVAVGSAAGAATVIACAAARCHAFNAAVGVW